MQASKSGTTAVTFDALNRQSSEQVPAPRTCCGFTSGSHAVPCFDDGSGPTADWGSMCLRPWPWSENSRVGSPLEMSRPRHPTGLTCCVWSGASGVRSEPWTRTGSGLRSSDRHGVPSWRVRRPQGASAPIRDGAAGGPCGPAGAEPPDGSRRGRFAGTGTRVGMTAVYTHTRPETVREQLLAALADRPALTLARLVRSQQSIDCLNIRSKCVKILDSR